MPTAMLWCSGKSSFWRSIRSKLNGCFEINVKPNTSFDVLNTGLTTGTCKGSGWLTLLKSDNSPVSLCMPGSLMEEMMREVVMEKMAMFPSACGPSVGGLQRPIDKIRS